jgi:hypothetical protein
MRILLKVSIPVAKGNAAIADGSLPQIMQTALGALKPEAAYFGAMNGRRTGLFFFDLADPSQIPVVAEPFFMGLEAELEFFPMMDAADLQKGLGALGSAAQPGG